MEFNNIYSGLISGKEKLALVGLGYVGKRGKVYYCSGADSG